jgi:WD40 repeat protein
VPVCWASSGGRLVTGSADGELRIVDTSTGPRRPPSSTSVAVECAAWTRGRRTAWCWRGTRMAAPAVVVRGDVSAVVCGAVAV